MIMGQKKKKSETKPQNVLFFCMIIDCLCFRLVAKTFGPSDVCLRTFHLFGMIIDHLSAFLVAKKLLDSLMSVSELFIFRMIIDRISLLLVTKKTFSPSQMFSDSQVFRFVYDHWSFFFDCGYKKNFLKMKKFFFATKSKDKRSMILRKNKRFWDIQKFFCNQTPTETKNKRKKENDLKVQQLF